MHVTNPREPVLTPVIGARPRLVVGEVVPGIAVPAVILAHRPPLSLAQIRSPIAPGRLPGLLQSLIFFRRHLVVLLQASPARLLLFLQSFVKIVHRLLTNIDQTLPGLL